MVQLVLAAQPEPSQVPEHSGVGVESTITSTVLPSMSMD